MTSLPELEAVRTAPPVMPAHTLAIGTRLREYEVKGLIGEGTCSIVYLAWDHALQRKVAVKEYMPAAMVGRIQGDRRTGGHGGAGLGRRLTVDSHLPGQDQRPRPLARGGQPAFDDHRVQPLRFLQCVRATTHRAIAGS